MASVACRVQYLDDSDPFICTNFPEPRRPPTVLLEENSPLSEQIAGIHKLLEAPLKVGHLVRAEPSREPLMVCRVSVESHRCDDEPPDCVQKSDQLTNRFARSL